MHLLHLPNSSQMFYDLKKEIGETFTKTLPDMTGMDSMESLADTIAPFNAMNHFNRTLNVAGAVLVLAIAGLLVLKCVLTYLCKIVRQREKNTRIYYEGA